MQIVYAVTTCSDKVYRQLFAEAPVKPAFQAQKYHRLLIEGLAAHAQVEVVANPPVNRSLMSEKKIQLPDETEGNARYHYIPAIRDPRWKLIRVGFGTFFKTLHYGDRHGAVVVDCLNRVAALSGLLASKVLGCPCVGIVTDLPDMLGGGGFSKKMANFVIRHCSHYVFLTEAMNRRLNEQGKPYVILEGHADISMGEKIPSLEKKVHPRVCMYAGGVSRQYGLDTLVEGFLEANIPDAVLEIYGPGDYVQELQALDAPNVRYGGMLLNHEIVEREMEATLLVNPRPTHEEFVKYSFPSKTMEYMASGTPVLTTRLPGMPGDYYPYVDFIRQETKEGVADALREVLSRSDEELFEKGNKARDFVLNHRNNVVQAQKILDMLEQ